MAAEIDIPRFEAMRRVSLVERRIELTSCTDITPPEIDELEATTREIIRTITISRYEPPTIKPYERKRRWS